MTSKANQSGFSLIEMMISAVIVLLVGAAGLMSVVVINRTSRAALDRTLAEGLLEQSRADVGWMTASFFDSIDQCQFPESLSSGQDACGLEDVPAEYAGFSRRMDVTVESPELKTVILTVSWNDRGAERTAQTIFRVARPSEAMPGNIVGCLKDSNTGNLIKGGVVTASPAEGVGGVSVQTLSTEEPLFDDKNFSFEDEVTGAFTLNTGLWSLKAEHDEYLDYVYEDADGNSKMVAVTAGKTTTLPECLEMQPIPGASYLTIRVFSTAPDGTQTMPLLNNDGAGVFARWDGPDAAGELGVHELGWKQIPTPFEETITIIPEQLVAAGGEICFTVFTRGTFRSRVVGEHTCRPGLTHERDGWSSARAAYGCEHNGQPVDWNGDNVPPTVCVGYDDHVELDIPLVQFPTLTVEGWIEAADGTPVSGHWPLSGPTQIRMRTKIYEDSGWGGADNECYYSTYSGDVPCIAKNLAGTSVWTPGSAQSANSNRFFHSCEQTAFKVNSCRRIDEANVNYRIFGLAMGAIFRDDECPVFPNPGWGTCNGVLYACGQVRTDHCCGEVTTPNVSVCTEEEVYRPSLLQEGMVLRHDFFLPVAPTVCGNLQGHIRNHTGAALAGAKAWAKWIVDAEFTNASGDYQYWCGSGSPDFKIPVDRSYILHAEMSGHYTYDSNSAASKYSYRMIRPPDIPANDTLNYPAITLLDRSSAGIITFVVKAQAGGAAIPNALVKVTQYDGREVDCTTNLSGQCSIGSILETWPPKRLVDNPAWDPGLPSGYTRLVNCGDSGPHGLNSWFCYVTKRHSVTASRSGYKARTVNSGALNKGEARTITIELEVQISGGGGGGGM